jgi:hypothetical protein
MKTNPPINGSLLFFVGWLIYFQITLFFISFFQKLGEHFFNFAFGFRYKVLCHLMTPEYEFLSYPKNDMAL